MNRWDQNRVLGALTAAESEALAPYARLVELESGAVLHEAGDSIREVYFPTSGVISMLTVTEEGHTIETSLVGREGVLGISAIVGDRRSPWRTVVQAPGRAITIPSTQIRGLLAASPPFTQAVLGGVTGLHMMASQTVACNRFHEVHQRVARWLLLMRDLSGLESFQLTHDFLASMLGVHRPTVTVTLGELEQTGLISRTRRAIVIADAEGLRDIACECYRRISDQLVRAAE